jgi:predicted trehalose synthase
LRRDEARRSVGSAGASAVGAVAGDAEGVGGARVSNVHHVLASLVDAVEFSGRETITGRVARASFVVQLASLVDAVKSRCTAGSIRLGTTSGIHSHVVVSRAGVVFSSARVCRVT